MTEYLTPKRIESHKQYLTDRANGVDTVHAWNAHKARMAETISPQFTDTEVVSPSDPL